MSRLSTELLATCAEACEFCAERVSSLSPDRRVPTFLRDAADRCRELIETIDRQPIFIMDAAAACANSCERLTYVGHDSMHSCVRESAELCRDVTSMCRGFVNTALPQAA